KGKYEEAVSEAVKAIEFSGPSPFMLASLGNIHAASGNVDEAQKILADLRELAPKRYVSPYHVALIYCHLGDKERVFSLLEETFERGDAWLAWLGVEPQFDWLRDDPRFTEYLRRTKNPSVERLSSGAEALSRFGAGGDAAAREAQARRHTDNEEAHQLYTAGRYYATRRTTEGLQQAIKRLSRAVELDPKFALAYAEMADCYALLNWYVEPPPAEAFEHAKQAALKAVEADDNLAEAHASLGFIKLHYDRDWEGAGHEFRRAIELKPGNALAHRWYAFNLSAIGRHDEAVAEIKRAQGISPKSPVIATAVANVLFLARRFDEAIAQCHRALELDSGSVAVYVVLRWAYERKGMREQALSAFEQERVFAGDTPTTHAKHAHVLAACGRDDEAREILDALLSRRDEQWVTAYEIAVIYSLLDERDDAFHCLA
ncbi:MAG TPA: tetratricopeptide repeat protein, partial [Pyrinomonadaceae bacterium]|nr:tetratricopeptide repeat protein [Pyrinomonadaceae bacterium]